MLQQPATDQAVTVDNAKPTGTRDAPIMELLSDFWILLCSDGRGRS